MMAAIVFVVAFNVALMADFLAFHRGAIMYRLGRSALVAAAIVALAVAVGL